MAPASAAMRKRLRYLRARRALRTFAREYFDLERRIAYMDGVGVDVHVLSLMGPLVDWAPGSLGLELAQTYMPTPARRRAGNIRTASPARPRPDAGSETGGRGTSSARASLPGLRGVNIGTEINGRNLDEKAFFPVYAKCEELGWPIFVHPINPLGRERMGRHYLQNLLGNPIEIGLAGYSLILGGVLDAFPKARDHAAARRRQYPLGHRPSAAHGRALAGRRQGGASRRATILRQFYFDTIIEDAELLLSLIRLVGVEQHAVRHDYASSCAIRGRANSSRP